MRRSVLQKYIQQSRKESLSNIQNINISPLNSQVDYFTLRNAHFSPQPISKNEREQRMNKIRSQMDLSFLDSTNKRAVIDMNRVDNQREGLVFNKFDPILHFDKNMRPNSFSWNVQQFNRRVVGYLLNQVKKNDKCK
jgi:hypothetical protein